MKTNKTMASLLREKRGEKKTPLSFSCFLQTTAKMVRSHWHCWHHKFDDKTITIDVENVFLFVAKCTQLKPRSCQSVELPPEILWSSSEPKIYSHTKLENFFHTRCKLRDDESTWARQCRRGKISMKWHTVLRNLTCVNSSMFLRPTWKKKKAWPNQ